MTSLGGLAVMMGVFHYGRLTPDPGSTPGRDIYFSNFFPVFMIDAITQIQI